jgi:hypothetical protein
MEGLRSLINHGMKKYLLEEFCRQGCGTLQPLENQSDWFTFGVLHGIKSQKTEIFITTASRILNSITYLLTELSPS